MVLLQAMFILGVECEAENVNHVETLVAMLLGCERSGYF